MKPVDQTTTGWEGNCFSACVASILELPIESVPQFMTTGQGNDDGTWWERFTHWCEANQVARCYHPCPCDPPIGYSIMTGRSPRVPARYHAVVAFDGVCVHDPHAGDRRGVGELLDYITIYRVVTV